MLSVELPRCSLAKFSHDVLSEDILGGVDIPTGRSNSSGHHEAALSFRERRAAARQEISANETDRGKRDSIESCRGADNLLQVATPSERPPIASFDGVRAENGIDRLSTALSLLMRDISNQAEDRKNENRYSSHQPLIHLVTPHFALD